MEQDRLADSGLAPEHQSISALWEPVEYFFDQAQLGVATDKNVAYV